MNVSWAWSRKDAEKDLLGPFDTEMDAAAAALRAHETEGRSSDVYIVVLIVDGVLMLDQRTWYEPRGLWARVDQLRWSKFLR